MNGFNYQAVVSEACEDEGGRGSSDCSGAAWGCPSTEHPRAWLWACIGLSGSCWKAASGKEDAVREQLKGMNAARFATGRRCLSLADTYH